MKDLLKALGGFLVITFGVGVVLAVGISCFCHDGCGYDGNLGSFGCEDSETEYITDVGVPTIEISCTAIDFKMEHVVPYAGVSCQLKSWSCSGCYAYNCYTCIEEIGCMN